MLNVHGLRWDINAGAHTITRFVNLRRRLQGLFARNIKQRGGSQLGIAAPTRESDRVPWRNL